ncbi:MAG: helix-turn-helix domain-containing protein [Bacilli bacterium]
MFDFTSNSLSMNIKNVSFRFNVRARFDVEKRPQNGFVYYVSGGHRFSFEKTEFEVRKGQFVYLPYGAKYTNRLLNKNTEYYQIDLSIYNKNGEPISFLKEPFYLKEEKSEQLESLFKNAFELYSQTIQNNILGVYSLILQILYKISRTDTGISYSHPKLYKIRKSVTYIEKNYMLSTPMTEIASYSSMCLSNFEKLFRQCFGVTASKYRNIVRIKHAKHLLSCGYSIAETCEKVGFSDVYYFTKAFKKITNKTPGAYVKETNIL